MVIDGSLFKGNTKKVLKMKQFIQCLWSEAVIPQLTEY